MNNELLTTRFFNTDDKKTGTVVFPLPPHWWSRFFEYAWAAEFCKETDTVLDAACGVPHPFKFFLAEKCKEVHAVDGDLGIENMNEIDRQTKLTLGHSVSEIKQTAERVQYKQANIAELPYGDGKFDVIFCISALEHMSSDESLKALKEFKRTLKDGGNIVLTIDYCKTERYASMTIDELENIAKKAGLKFAGGKETDIPENAINWDNELYCFRAVLVKDIPAKKPTTKSSTKAKAATTPKATVKKAKKDD